MRKIFIAQNPAQAHLVAGLLDESGIRCAIEGEMLTGARFELGMDSSTLPTVSVNDEDADRAIEVLRERGHAGAAPEPSTPSAADAMPERRGLARFKTFLIVWLVMTGISFAVTTLFVPGALLLCAVFGLVVALAWPLVRRS